MAKESKKGVDLEEAKRSAPQGANYLLAIAIDDYVHCPKLYNCVRDANDLVKLLTERYLFEPQNVTVLINEEATKSNIYNALRKLASETTSRDNVLIYFSGHGEYDKIFKQGYWIPVDTPEGHYDQYIPNSEIKTILNAINSHHTFLMVDSCFAGALFAKGVGKNVSKRYEADPSRWGLTSGRNEVVSDGKPGDNSPFAESLLYRLRQNTASLGVSELCSYVVEYVQANSNQTPIGEPLKVEGHKNGQFVFRLRKDDGVKQPKPAPKKKPTGKKKPVPPQGMVFVEGGAFDMGDTFGDGNDNEQPVHTVTVSDFYMGACAVTFEEYDSFCEAMGWEKPGDSGWGRGRRPVINVSWYNAVAYCNWRSLAEGLEPCFQEKREIFEEKFFWGLFKDNREIRTVYCDFSLNGYRLPTDAEWEYAARQRGQRVRFGNGKNIADPAEINFDGTSQYKQSYSKEGVYRGKTTEVGSFAPNSLGLYDMSGNVLEWCWDWYDEDYYKKSYYAQDPKGPDSGYDNRVIRGGSWMLSSRSARCSSRARRSRLHMAYDCGFRLARTITQ